MIACRHSSADAGLKYGISSTGDFGHAARATGDTGHAVREALADRQSPAFVEARVDAELAVSVQPRELLVARVVEEDELRLGLRVMGHDLVEVVAQPAPPADDHNGRELDVLLVGEFVRVVEQRVVLPDFDRADTQEKVRVPVVGVEKRHVRRLPRCLEGEVVAETEHVDLRDRQSARGQPGSDVSLRVLRDGENRVADRVHVLDVVGEAFGGMPAVLRRDDGQQVVGDVRHENTVTVQFDDVVDEQQVAVLVGTEQQHVTARGTDVFRAFDGGVPSEDRPYRPLRRGGDPSDESRAVFRPVDERHQACGTPACVSADGPVLDLSKRPPRTVPDHEDGTAVFDEPHRELVDDSLDAGQLPPPAGQCGDIDDQSPGGTDAIHAAIVPTGGQRIVGRACENVQRFPSRSSAT